MKMIQFTNMNVKSGVIVVRLKVPWFNDSLKKLKATHRKLERKMLKTHLQCDKDAFRILRNKFSTLLNAARTTYYSELIENCAGNSKKLFIVVNSLCKE